MNVKFVLVVLMLVCLCNRSAAQIPLLGSCADNEQLCGVQSLLVVCRELQIKTDLAELKQLSQYKEDVGVSMAGLKRAAESKGLKVQAVKISLDELVKLDKLAILYLFDAHFISAKVSGKDTLTVVGSSEVPIHVKVSELASVYSGFALLISDQPFTLPTNSSGPDLRVDSYVKDFGVLERDKTASRTFVVTNAGDRDLHFLSPAETSCPCLSVKMPKYSLAPGEKTEITGVFDSHGQELWQNWSIAIKCNDPITPAVLLNVMGYVRSQKLLMSPRELNLGKVQRSADEIGEVYVRSTPEEDVRILSVKSDSPHIKAESTPSKHPDLPGYILRISVSPDAPLGQMKGKLVVETTHPHESKADVIVTAEVQGDVEIQPGSMFFGEVKADKERNAIVRVSSSAKAPFKIMNAKCSLPCVALSVTEDEKGKSFNIIGHITSGAPIGNLEGNLTISTNDPSQKQITIPVHAFIVP